MLCSGGIIMRPLHALKGKIMKRLNILLMLLSLIVAGSFASCNTSKNGDSSIAQSSSVIENSTSMEEESSLQEKKTLEDWLVACDGALICETTDAKYIREGGDGYSISYKHGDEAKGAHVGTGIKFINSSAQDTATFSFYVYNASLENYEIEVFCHSNLSSEIFQDYQKVNSYTAVSGEWTQITVLKKDIGSVCMNGAFNVLGVAVKSDANGGNASEKWSNLELYFDGLSVFEK
jgi:hypothetical protein